MVKTNDKSDCGAKSTSCGGDSGTMRRDLEKWREKRAAYKGFINESKLLPEQLLEQDAAAVPLTSSVTLNLRICPSSRYHDLDVALSSSHLPSSGTAGKLYDLMDDSQLVNLLEENASKETENKINGEIENEKEDEDEVARQEEEKETKHYPPIAEQHDRSGRFTHQQELVTMLGSLAVIQEEEHDHEDDGEENMESSEEEKEDETEAKADSKMHAANAHTRETMNSSSCILMPVTRYCNVVDICRQHSESRVQLFGGDVYCVNSSPENIQQTGHKTKEVQTVYDDDGPGEYDMTRQPQQKRFWGAPFANRFDHLMHYGELMKLLMDKGNHGLMVDEDIQKQQHSDAERSAIVDDLQQVDDVQGKNLLYTCSGSTNERVVELPLIHSHAVVTVRKKRKRRNSDDRSNNETGHFGWRIMEASREHMVCDATNTLLRPSSRGCNIPRDEETTR